MFLSEQWFPISDMFVYADPTFLLARFGGGELSSLSPDPFFRFTAGSWGLEQSTSPHTDFHPETLMGNLSKLFMPFLSGRFCFFPFERFSSRRD